MGQIAGAGAAANALAPLVGLGQQIAGAAQPLIVEAQQFVAGIKVGNQCEDNPPPKFVVPSWCDADATKRIGALLAAPNQGADGWFFRGLAGFRPSDRGRTYKWPWWGCTLFGRSPGKWATLVVSSIYFPLAIWDRMYQGIAPPKCSIGGLTPLLLTDLLIGLFERWGGFVGTPIRTALNTTENFVCPQVVADPAVVIARYLHNEIDRDAAGEWCQASGWCPQTTEWSIAAAQVRIAPAQLVDLWHRGIIASDTELDSRLRAAGVLNQTDRDNLKDGSAALLGVGDICRLLHLCRPGAPPGRPSYGEDDAKRDLKALGYDDRGQRLMMFLCRTDLGHRQLLQPYLDGSLSDETLKSYLLDDGYDQDDISRLMPHYQHARVQYVDKEVGIPTVAQASKDVVDGKTNAATWAEVVKLWDVSPILYDAAGQVVEYERQAAIRAAGIQSVKAAFDAGETDAGTALMALAEYGITGQPATDLVQVWALGQSIRRKPSGPAQLCTWFTSGLLSESEYVGRLLSLHYSPADVRRIITLCSDANRRKLEAAAAKEAAKEAAAAQKAATAEGKEKAAAIRLQRQANLAAARAALAIQKAQLAAIRGDLHAAESVTGHVHTREAAALTGKLATQPGPQADQVAEQAAPPASGLLPP